MTEEGWEKFLINVLFYCSMDAIRSIKSSKDFKKSALCYKMKVVLKLRKRNMSLRDVVK